MTSVMDLTAQIDTESTANSDETLMLAFAAGNADAFERLYRRHRGPLYRFIKRAVGVDATAEELFQDVWVKLIDARGRYKVAAKFQTWLYRIAHHRVIDHFRRARPTYDIDAGNGPELTNRGPEPDQMADAEEIGRKIDNALRALPLEQRAAFLLQVESGFSLETIGEICGVGRETIKSRLRYASVKLRDELGECHEQQA